MIAMRTGGNVMKHRRPITLSAVLFMLIALSPKEGNSQSDSVWMPKETLFTLELLSPISTDTNQKGDRFNCKVLSPSEFRNAIVAGEISKIKGSGKASGKSEIALVFKTISLPNGREGSFAAQIKEVYDVSNTGNSGRADNEGVVSGKSRVKRDAIKIGIGTAVGAIIGGILGGPKGAAVGGAIGAAASTTTVLAMKGPNMNFKEGTQFTVITY